MALHNDFGKKGEELAAAFLVGKGYTILHRNWRHGRDEIDIVAIRDNIMHFIEVKTRKGLSFGYPEESVSPGKIRRMMRSAASFVHQHACRLRTQFDVLSILARKDRDYDYLLIEDVSA